MEESNGPYAYFSSDVSPFVPFDRRPGSIDVFAGQILLRLAYQVGNVGDAHNAV
jgi:hypothetical protein